MYFLLRAFPNVYYCPICQKRTKETVIINRQLQSRAIYSLYCGFVEIRDYRLQCGFKWSSCITSWRLTYCRGRAQHSWYPFTPIWDETERPAFGLDSCFVFTFSFRWEEVQYLPQSISMSIFESVLSKKVQIGSWQACDFHKGILLLSWKSFKIRLYSSTISFRMPFLSPQVGLNTAPTPCSHDTVCLLFVQPLPHHNEIICLWCVFSTNLYIPCYLGSNFICLLHFLA